MYKRVRIDDRISGQQNQSDYPDDLDSDSNNDELIDTDPESQQSDDNQTNDDENDHNNDPSTTIQRNEYSCTLCPKKQLLNQSGVDQHLTSKYHLKKLKQYRYNNRTADEINKLKQKNQCKRDRWLAKKHPEKLLHKQSIQSQFNELGNDPDAVNQLRIKLRRDKLKRHRKHSKQSNTDDTTTDIHHNQLYSQSIDTTKSITVVTTTDSLHNTPIQSTNKQTLHKSKSTTE